MNLCPLIDEAILCNSSHQASVALRWKTGEITYDQLRGNARRVAARLNEFDVGLGDRVGIALPKSPEYIQTMLGTLAAGAAYVPLSSTFPLERIVRILEHAEPRVTLTTSAICESLGNANVGKVIAIEDWSDHGTSTTDSMDVDPQQLGALYYTSGSTGEPKAVMRSRGNLVHFIRWVTERFSICENDRIAHVTPLNFALSQLDLFSGLASGASLFLVDEITSRFPAAVTGILQEQKTTVLCCSPTALTLICGQKALKGRDLSSLRLVLFGGESMPAATLREMMERLPHVQFVSLYGSTETDVCAYNRLTSFPDVQQTRIPIGVPCEHLDVSLSDDHGEMIVTGPTVLPGYWRRPDLTASCRMGNREDSFRTGDFARWEDDRLHFHGRRDNIVKIRGQRVELAEVEAWLAEHPLVRQAVVVVKEAGDLQATLVAFVTSDNQTPSLEELDKHCRRRLPNYAIPSCYDLLTSFPTTSTGKVDRVALAKQAIGAR